MDHAGSAVGVSSTGGGDAQRRGRRHHLPLAARGCDVGQALDRRRASSRRRVEDRDADGRGHRPAGEDRQIYRFHLRVDPLGERLRDAPLRAVGDEHELLVPVAPEVIADPRASFRCIGHGPQDLLPGVVPEPVPE